MRNVHFVHFHDLITIYLCVNYENDKAQTGTNWNLDANITKEQPTTDCTTGNLILRGLPNMENDYDDERTLLSWRGVIS